MPLVEIFPGRSRRVIERHAGAASLEIYLLMVQELELRR